MCACCTGRVEAQHHTTRPTAPPPPLPRRGQVISEIKADWLLEVAPHMYSRKDIAEDSKKLPKAKGKAAEVS